MRNVVYHSRSELFVSSKELADDPENQDYHGRFHVGLLILAGKYVDHF